MLTKTTNSLAISDKLIAVFIAGIGLSTATLVSLMIVTSISTHNPSKAPNKPQIYQAIPTGKEGYYWLGTDTTNLMPGQTFDVGVFLENTPQLDIDEPSGSGSYGQGIATAKVTINFDPSKLQAVDLDTNTAGTQLLKGAIFSAYRDNSIDNTIGVGTVMGYHQQGDTTYPYNSYYTGTENNPRPWQEKMFATIRFNVVGSVGDNASIIITGTDANDGTNILTNIQGYLYTDILNQSLADNNGNLELTISEAGSPTATPTPPEPTNTPPPPTPTPPPGGCDNGLKLEDGDLNQDCLVNMMDWTIMWKYWTSY